MISLKRNPLTWDKQSIGRILTPTITSVKLFLDGRELNVKKIPTGDELRVEIPTPNTVMVSESVLTLFQQ